MPFEKILELANAVGGLRGYQLQVVLREFYCDTYRINDLDDPNRPLALVATSPIDGNSLMYSLYNRIRRFKLYEMGKKYSISLPDFLNLPRDVVTMMFDDAELEAAREKAVKDELARKKALEESRQGKLDLDDTALMAGFHLGQTTK